MSEQASQKKITYDLFFQTDLNRKYNISIKRDPCFGKEKEIQAAATQVKNIKAGYITLYQKFGAHSNLNNPEGAKIFNEMKALLLKQYPKMEETSTCPDIQSNIETYNCYVDTIQNMRCDFQIIKEKQTAMLGLSADYILTTARKIDNYTNKWLLSSDNIEKKDLEVACKQAIDLIETHVGRATVINNEQQAALGIFNKAKTYFRQTCQKK